MFGQRARRGKIIGRSNTNDSASWATIDTLEARRFLSVSVSMGRDDPGRTGLNSNEVLLTPSNVNTSTFGQAFSYPVQGQVYAQPLYVPNVAIPGQGTHNVLLVATENNDVYAFDGDSNSGVGGGVLWHVNLGLAAATPNSFFANRYGPYHDLTPQVGITSTPVIDPATNTVYIDAFTNDVAGQDAYSHHVHALDLTTGADKVTPMLVSAAVRGTSVGGDGTTVTFSAEHELQRPALSLLNGVLYVAYSGYADTDPYHGWILGFNESNLQVVSVLNTTPNAGTDSHEGEGGIWQSGGGLASDGTHMFVSVGNGDFDPSVGDYGDSVLSITPDNSSQANPNKTGYGTGVNDSFTPYNEQALSDADSDLGSGGVLLLPDQPGTYPHLMINAGKQGVIYLINRDNMGGFNASTDNVVQKVSIGHGVYGSPAYFNSSIYYHGGSDYLKRFSLTNGVLSAAPAAQATVSNISQMPTPSISSNGTANGIVWETQWDTTHAILRAYDATTLTELYDSNQNAARDQLGPGVKFVTPTVANGHVYAATAGAVSVFTLLAPPTTPPAAPSNLTATAASQNTVNLAWVDNSNNEGGFKIERSTDNATFTQIGVASANATSYADTTAAGGTKYYYRIRATNAIGDSAYTIVASATTPVSTAPVDIYHFDAGSGTSTVDSVGTNNGTLTGSSKPTWTTGHIGAYALSFTGDGTYDQATVESNVQLTSDLSPVLGSTSTLSTWIKTTQVGNGTHWKAPAITGSEVAGSANDINWGSLDATGHIGIYVGDAGGVFSTSPVNDGAWHNVTITRDASTGIVQVYIDGVLNASGRFDTGTKSAPFNVIGGLTDLANDGTTRTGGNYYSGSLDEVRIYNQVLSSNEIQALALTPAVPTLQSATVATGPVVHLTFSNPSSYAQNLVVERSDGSSGTYSTLATLAASATVYDDPSVVAGTQYTYRLRATDVAGTSLPSNTITVTPQVPTVIQRYVIYNESSFDGMNGSSDYQDDRAIATDKQALLPGQTASFANYTSYSKGINGIMIDIANLVTLPRIDDFTFAVGNDNTPGGWASAPTPLLVNTYPGRGANGSTEITIIWADNAIQNDWLRVTVLAQPHLGLAADDVFYYGNAIGETGNSTTDAAVDSADELRTRSHLTGLGSAAITNLYDFNRDGYVNTQDVLITRANRSGLSPLKLITVPATPAPAIATATKTAKSAKIVATPATTTNSPTSKLTTLLPTKTISISDPLAPPYSTPKSTGVPLAAASRRPTGRAVPRLTSSAPVAFLFSPPPVADLITTLNSQLEELL